MIIRDTWRRWLPIAGRGYVRRLETALLDAEEALAAADAYILTLETGIKSGITPISFNGVPFYGSRTPPLARKVVE